MEPNIDDLISYYQSREFPEIKFRLYKWLGISNLKLFVEAMLLDLNNRHRRDETIQCLIDLKPIIEEMKI